MLIGLPPALVLGQTGASISGRVLIDVTFLQAKVYISPLHRAALFGGCEKTVDHPLLPR
jgi:hypothetical protein